MKALSLKQPWANMVASGQKTIETRTWATKHRGPILIVSSKYPRIFPAGYAVAIANVVDCRPMSTDDEEAACCKVYTRAISWILEEVRKIEPIPMKGELGVYDCPLEIEDVTFI